MWKSIMMIFCLLLIGLASTIYGADLVCDPQTGVTDYRILGLDAKRTIVPAEADGSVKYDVGVLAPGGFSGTMEAGKRYVLDGVPQPAVQWSSPVPFVLTVPDPPVDSKGLSVIDF
jgi:hypothetical protein